jgi:histidinol dehydrogenase
MILLPSAVAACAQSSTSAALGRCRLAFGTESVAKSIIFGGQLAGDEAKRQVSQRLDGAAIDMPPGRQCW